ncbi:MAG: ATP-binding protein [Candidatus Promineifilaceae bacterium]
MPFDFWGASSVPNLVPPERVFGFFVLALYSLLFVAALFKYRTQFSTLSARQWFFVVGLSLTSFAASQLFPFALTPENQLPPLASAQNPAAFLVPFGAVPFVIAGALINPAAALIVGFCSGIGRSFWQSHQYFDPFHFAFAAVIAATLIRQRYNGRAYKWLRRPVISSILALLLVVPLVAIATRAYAEASASNLAAFDLAISTAKAFFLPYLIEGLLAGLVTTLVLAGLPQLRQAEEPLVPAPASSSLNNRLIASFLLFAFILISTLVIVGFNLAVNVSIDLAVEQMANDAQSVSAMIMPFRAERQQLLSENGTRLTGDPKDDEELLMQIFRVGTNYRQLILEHEPGEIDTIYPDNNEADDLSLTNMEETAADSAFESGAPFVSPAQQLNDGSFVISFVVPVENGNSKTDAVLIGRVPDISLQVLAAGLQNTLGEGEGFIVDEQSQIIAHPDKSRLMTTWEPPESPPDRIDGTADMIGSAYLGLRGNTNSREVVYYQKGPDHPWTVVITVPYEVILETAIQISSGLVIVVVIAMLLFVAYLYFVGRSITGPLTELAVASKRIAGGSLNTPISPQGNDEIGHLGQAFRQMQVSLKQRLDELGLLLEVSQQVSSTVDINQGMPSILQAALRRTGASGARVVVLNHSGRQPLMYGEGPASEIMSNFDRQIMSLARHKSVVTLPTPDEVSNQLDPKQQRLLPIKALVTIPLNTHKQFQGVFWLAYRQAHVFDQTELDFLQTITSQASVLVDNARLFATAEGGRRRLAAVLASTADAVIVTDPTEHILLINPAMERFFNLKANEAVGRPMKAVIKSKRLIEALASTSERTRDLEIPIQDGIVLYASASTIFSNDSQMMGRVAVLRDITYLKEVDEMKSEFVATVSHDLRSPLTFMRGYATMMPMVGDLNDKQQEYVDKILNGIEQMSSLINDLLDLGRLEAGIDLVVSKFRIMEVLTSIIEEYHQPAQLKGIDLIVTGDSRRVPPIRGDISLIRQAITNYVNNAIKYAPHSGQVILDATTEGSEIIISVRDNGPGIPKKEQLRLYEKFYRVPQRGAEVVKGSGLGLALVKSIAERHGGRAWCESTVGKGSVFYISLPVGKRPSEDDHQ